MDNQPIAQSSPSINTPSSSSIKIRISKKILYIAGTLLLLAIVIGSYYVFTSSRPTVLAVINNQPVYSSYVDKELQLFPGSKTPEVEKLLKQKVIDDQVTLEGAKKQGLIKSYDNNPSMDSQTYIERTKQVLAIKKEINESANSISGTMVSLWMYNNNYIGPKGLEKEKEFAYSKIKPLYDKVISGKMTITQAGEAIRNDKTLKEVDPVWEVNAISDFTFYKGKSSTFWKEFNDILWNTAEGKVTPLYLGTGRHNHQPEQKPELYIFAKIDKRITDKPYNGYDEWLSQQKDAMHITMKPLLTVPKAFADNDNCNGGCEDNHGLAEWNVTVSTLTGADVPYARIHHTNGWGGADDYTTNAHGVFGIGASYSAGCGANPHQFTIYAPNNAISNAYPSSTSSTANSFVQKAFAQQSVEATAVPTQTAGAGQQCGTITVHVVNYQTVVNQSMPCNTIIPTITPTPILTCNHGCTTDVECQHGVDGCTVCLPNPDTDAGGNTCQPGPSVTPTTPPGNPTPTTPPGTPTPTPVTACGSPCARDGDCIGGATRNGCTVCQANASGQKVCSPPTPTPTPILACNTTCQTDAQCQLGVDGCTVCLPSGVGTTKVCKTPPACGVSCVRDTDCTGARNGCTTCNAGKCSAFNPDMCACDGMDFTLANGTTTFFPGDNVTFIAFGKVEGVAINAADLKSMKFSLYQSKLSDPNTATRIAQSADIIPAIVQSDSSKVRYKVTWDQKIPSSVPSGTLFRVQADITCAAKPGVLGAKTQSIGNDNYFTKLYDSIAALFTAGNVLSASDQQIQLQPFYPGAKIQEKSCKIMKFFFE